MNLLFQIEQYVFQLYKDKLLHQFTYHNYNHTLRVVAGLEEIISHINLPEEDKLKLRLAAWLHDIGYTQSCDNHEEKGAEMAVVVLKEFALNEEDINAVKNLILATKLSHTPNNLLEEIIKDADFAHFTDKNYIEVGYLLKQETELNCSKKFTTKEWNKSSLDFLMFTHKYYTAYAREHWSTKKFENILLLNKEITKNDKKQDKPSKKDSFRSIDTLFRTTLRNHMQLSAIADSKANILLSVNAIIISICLSTLIPKLDSPSNSHLVFPTFILILFSLASIISAILSTKPKVTAGTFSKEELENNTVNLLFFGSFHKMPLDEYYTTLRTMIQDEERIYHSLTKDLYYLGQVLNKKYALLRITYLIFTVGIILSVIAFIYAFKHIGL